MGLCELSFPCEQLVKNQKSWRDPVAISDTCLLLVSVWYYHGLEGLRLVDKLLDNRFIFGIEHNYPSAAGGGCKGVHFLIPAAQSAFSRLYVTLLPLDPRKFLAWATLIWTGGDPRSLRYCPLASDPSEYPGRWPYLEEHCRIFDKTALSSH